MSGPRRPDVRLLPALAVAWAAAWWGTAAGAAPQGPLRVGCAGAACLVLAVCLLLPGRSWGRSRGRSPGQSPGRSRGVGRLRRVARGGSRRAVASPAVVLVLAVGGLVLAATASRCASRYRAPLPALAAERAVVEVRGTVVDDPRPLRADRYGRRDGVVVTVRAGRLTARGRADDVDAPLLVLGGPAWGGVTAGRSVVAVGRLGAVDPGDDVVALLAVTGAPAATARGAWPWRLADRLRAGLRAASEGLPTDAGGLLPSLVVGDTSRLPESLRADLQTAGLTHVTAVSGANVAIAAGAALWLAAALGAHRRVRVLITALVLVGFVVVARPQPSVLRAAAMGAVALAGLASGRRSGGVPVLAAAAIGLLVVDPWLARGAGFVLSCLATAGLLLLAPVWTRRLRAVLRDRARVPGRPAGVLAAALSVPAAAQAFCGPVLVLLQPSVSLVSVPANLLAEPAVAPATVLGLLAAAVAPAWPAAAHGLAWLAGWATGWIAAVAHRTAALPLASLPWPGGAGGALLLAAVTGVLVAASVGLPVRRRPGADPARGGPGGAVDAAGGDRAGRRAAGGRRRGRVAAALVVVLAVVVGWWVAPRLGGGAGAWPPPDWAVAQCDVGQGAAMAVRSGGDRAVLVDVGPDPALVDRCLADLGVRHLDLVLLTHFHADHVGGLAGALDGRDVAGPVLVSPLGEPGENAAAVRSTLAGPGSTAVIGRRGLAGRAGAAPGDAGWSVAWRVLAPTADPGDPVAPQAPPVGARAGPDDGTGVNEASLAYVLDVAGPGGTLRIAGMGDLETQGQDRLRDFLAADGAGPVDVVEVAHHGSARQVPGLYRLLSPRVALIGVGAGNDYGHPAATALAMLQDAGARVLRTDVDGSVALSPAPDGGLAIRTRR